MGLTEVVAIEVGGTIGAGVFAMTSIGAAMCGPSLPLAYALAAVPVAFMMLTLAGLSSALPTVGGAYRYPSRLFSPLWAFLGVWGYALGMVFGVFPLLAATCADYVQTIWPSVPGVWFSVGALTLFFITNLFGIGIAAIAQMLMVFILISALVSFGIGGLGEVKFSNFRPFMPGGWSGLVAAAAMLTFAHQGANAVIELGGEIKNPGRNMPLSLFISIPFITVIYVMVSFVAVGVVHWREVADERTLAGVAQVFMRGPWFIYFVLGGAVLAITTSINTTYMVVTKSLMALSNDGLFPQWLSKTHPRHGTPWRFLTIVWGLSCFAIMAGFPVETFANYAAIGSLLIYMPIMISSMALKYRRPEAYAKAPFKLKGPLYWIAPGLGFGLAALSIGIILFDTIAKDSSRGVFEICLFIIWICFGYVLFRLLSSRIEKEKGRNIRLILSSDTFD